MLAMSWQDVVATGGVTIVGGVAGWFLNELSETRRHRAQKLDEAKSADSQRVLTAARQALTVASRGQTLAHGAIMKARGQTLSREQWNEFVGEFNEAHAALGLVDAEIKLHGPALARAPVAALKDKAKSLLDDIVALDNGNKLTQDKLAEVADLVAKIRDDVDTLLNSAATAV